MVVRVRTAMSKEDPFNPGFRNSWYAATGDLIGESGVPVYRTGESEEEAIQLLQDDLVENEVYGSMEILRSDGTEELRSLTPRI